MAGTNTDGEPIAGPSNTSSLFRKRGLRAKVGQTLRSRRTTIEDEGKPSTDDQGGETLNDEDDEAIALEDLVALRALRHNDKGIDLEKLNRGDVQTKKSRKDTKAAAKSKEELKEDRWAEQMRRGGLMVTGKTEDTKDASEDEDDDTATKDTVRLVNRNNFQGETGTVDVDKHMMAYIEEQMQRRRQGQETDKDVISAVNEVQNPEDELYRVAEKYRQIQQAAKDAIALERSRVNTGGAAQFKGIIVPTEQADDRDKEEGNAALSTTMLSGIPEVDLGVDYRLQNIEATERARQKLEMERSKRQRIEHDDDDDDDYDELAAVRFFRHRNRVATDAERAAQNADLLESSFEFTENAQPMAARRTHQTATDDAALERFKKRQRNQLKR